MFNRNRCNKCHSEYDSLEPNCPNCGAENSENRYSRKNRNIVIMPARRQFLTFLVSYIGFQIIGTMLQYLMIFVGTNIYGLDLNGAKVFVSSVKISAMVNFLSYLIVFILSVITIGPNIKKLFKSFTNVRPYFIGIAGCAAIYAFNYIYGNFIHAIGLDIGDNANESTLGIITNNYPLVSIIIFGLIGPFVEELGYRVGLFTILKRKSPAIAYVGTALIFAFIHFSFPTSGTQEEIVKNLINEILNLPYYMFAGLTLSFLYDKFGFASSYTAHTVNNIFSLIVSAIYYQK